VKRILYETDGKRELHCQEAFWFAPKKLPIKILVISGHVYAFDDPKHPDTANYKGVLDDLEGTVTYFGLP